MGHQFRSIPRRPRTPDGYRLATAAELEANLNDINQSKIIKPGDVICVLDAWAHVKSELITGRELDKNTVPDACGGMLIIETDEAASSSDGESLRKNLYSNVNLDPKRRKMAFFLACQVCDTEVIYWVLNGLKNDDQLVSLIKSAMEIIPEYLESGTPLHALARYGNDLHATEIVKLIVDKFGPGGEKIIRSRDKNLRTVLHVAAKYIQENLCYFLTVKRENYQSKKMATIPFSLLRIEDEDRYSQNTLHYIAKADDRSVIVERLVHNSESVYGTCTSKKAINARDRKGRTPLHIAAEKGNTKIVETLLRWGSNRSLADFSGITALHTAALLGNVEIIKLLFQQFEPHQQLLLKRDGNKKTALHYAVDQNDSTTAKEVAGLLLNFCKSKEEKSLLLWSSAPAFGTAEEFATSREVKEFLQQRKKETQEVHLLRAAAISGNIGLTLEFLKRGADIADLYNDLWITSLKNHPRENAIKVRRYIATLAEQGRDEPSMTDNLGRKDIAEAIAAMFLDPYVKSPITVGIYGDWGTGKSSLMLQTKNSMLKTAAQLAFPNSLQVESFPGAKAMRLSSKGKTMYERILAGMRRLLAENECDLDSKIKDPMIYLLQEYRPQYHVVYQSLAVMDRSDMCDNDCHQRSVAKSRAPPAILIVDYNAWHYCSAKEAWAGLAFEVTKAMEATMTKAQYLRTCWRYAWLKECCSIFNKIILPCLLAAFVAVFVGWAAWLILSRSKHEEITNLKYGSIPLTVISIGWGLAQSVIGVVKPISVQMKEYVGLPDQSGQLGYQQKVIEDIKFLKQEIGNKPSRFWSFIAGEWCWNWFGLYSNYVDGTTIPKMIPASEENIRIIVFVDDLDRCQESIILEVLSAINLVLAACEINVIIGMDEGMIQRAIVKSFQQANQSIMEDDLFYKDLARNYMSKIIQLPLTLPDPSHHQSKRFFEWHLGETMRRANDEDAVARQESHQSETKNSDEQNLSGKDKYD